MGLEASEGRRDNSIRNASIPKSLLCCCCCRCTLSVLVLQPLHVRGYVLGEFSAHCLGELQAQLTLLGLQVVNDGISIKPRGFEGEGLLFSELRNEVSELVESSLTIDSINSTVVHQLRLQGSVVLLQLSNLGEELLGRASCEIARKGCALCVSWCVLCVSCVCVSCVCVCCVCYFRCCFLWLCFGLCCCWCWCWWWYWCC